MKHIIIIVLTVLVFSCKDETKTKTLENGRYRAELKVNDTLSLPFNFEVISGDELYIFNAEEVIEVKGIGKAKLNKIKKFLYIESSF